MFIFGVLRLKTLDANKVDFVLGYDKSISVDVKFLFSESIRKNLH